MAGSRAIAPSLICPLELIAEKRLSYSIDYLPGEANTVPSCIYATHTVSRQSWIHFAIDDFKPAARETYWIIYIIRGFRNLLQKEYVLFPKCKRGLSFNNLEYLSDLTPK